MFKYIWLIFKRDFKVNLRDVLGLMFLLFPILFGLIITWISPGINDTSVKIAFLENENKEQIEYFKKFAKVETFKNLSDIIRRIEKRDNMVAILPENKGSNKKYYILTQGNEPSYIIDYAKFLKANYELGVDIDDSNATIKEFGVKQAPLTRIFTNVFILFVTIMSGMVISLNILEEKVDGTIKAINVSPVNYNEFILGKSVIGIIENIWGAAILLILAGYYNINIGMLVLILISSTILSLIVGFVEGIVSTDIMSAAGNVKMLFIPLAAAVTAVEFLSKKWQILFYWIPYYWAYKANDAILSNTATWPQILLYGGIVVILSVITYIIFSPKIKEGLK